MREETKNWLEQAGYDFEAANKNSGLKIYNMAAFLSQQCAEKALKALAIEKLREIPKTYDLIHLSEELACPPAIHSCLIELNADYAVSRYPDAANGVPSKAYDFAKADRKLRAAKQVLDWVESCIK